MVAATILDFRNSQILLADLSWRAKIHHYAKFHQNPLIHCRVIVIFYFYCTMHYSAECGLVIACRLSICLFVSPSVTLVDHDHIG